MFWDRKSNDPLLRALIDCYKLNLLSVPRQNSEVGDLYVETKDGISSPGKLKPLLTPGFELPTQNKGEIMAGISGKISENIAVNLGISFLEGFLSVLGAGGILSKLKAAYETNRAKNFRFSFPQMIRDSMDPMEFGLNLIDHRLNEKHPFVDSKNRYYVVTAVVRTDSIKVHAEDDQSNIIDFDVGVLMSADIESKIEIEKSATGDIQYSGKMPLAIGVELHEMNYDEKEQKFKLKILKEPIRIRAQEEETTTPPSFIGDPDGNAFIEIK